MDAITHTLTSERTRRSYTPSPMDVVVKEAARRLNDLTMTKLSLEPERDDLTNILKDFEVLTDIFDTVIKELGEYAGEFLGVNPKDIKAHFHDQVNKALEGDGLFLLQEAFREIDEERKASYFNQYDEA